MQSRIATFTIIRKELSSYFNSPIAYIFLFVFLALIGFLFMSQFFLIALADMRILFMYLPVILCVFLPAMTMRSWAEERQGGTYELLLTFPMKAHELVLGKFLASFLFYIIALAATFTIPIMLMVVGSPDSGTIIGGYLGAACLGAFFISVGIFVSSLCRDQIVAFIVAMLACFTLFLIGTEFIASTIDGWIPGFGSFLMMHVGISHHFTSFQKGVVDFRDVGFFLIGTLLMLVLNGFWIEGRLRPGQRRLFVITSFVSTAIFVIGNWLISDLPLGRFDFTEGKLYTVSPVTRKILSELKAPVTIKYYVSPDEKMPTGFKTLERDVLDKLDEFRLASGGKLNYKVFHMEAANVSLRDEDSLEMSLQRKGINPFQIQSIEADEMGLRLVYSTMAIAYKEKPDEILPRIIPSNLHQLEYLVLSKIYRMKLASTPKIALFSPFTETPFDPRFKMMLEQLGQKVPENQVDDSYRLIPMVLESEGYEIDRITLTDDDPIPDDADTLVILEPKEITEDQRKAISSFLVEGGSVMIAAQLYQYRYATSAGQVTMMLDKTNPGINPLLSEWGVELDERILLDESADTLNVGAGAAFGPFMMNIPLKLPVHIRINPDSMNQDISITSRLSSILYLWGSALSIDDDKLKEHSLSAASLLHSSQKSWTISPSEVGRMAPGIKPGPDDIRGPFPLAVLIEGEFPDPFKDVRTDKLSPAKGKLFLMGAFTPFQERLLERGGHLNLFMNTVDTLTLGDELVQIRAKQPINRSLQPVSSGAKAWWRFFVSLLIPLGIVLIGWVRLLLRQRSKSQYLQFINASR